MAIPWCTVRTQFTQGRGFRCASEIETSGTSLNSLYKGARSGMSSLPCKVVIWGTLSRRV